MIRRAAFLVAALALMTLPLLGQSASASHGSSPCILAPGAFVNHCAFAGQNHAGENLSGINAKWTDWRGGSVSGADLSGSQLGWSIWSNADLSGATFSGSRMNHTIYWFANATGADFRNAYLVAAQFGFANLTGADFTGADLTGALYCQTTMPDGSINDDDCAAQGIPPSA